MVKSIFKKKVLAAATFFVVSAAVVLSGFSMQNAKADTGNYAYPSTQYVKHDYTTGQNTTYTLPAIASVNYGNALAMQAMADANEDTRPNAKYDSATVKITGNYGGYTAEGTGFIIGEHEIMTAAHVVDQFTGCTFTVTVPDANPYSSNSQKFDVKSVHIPKSYIDFTQSHVYGDSTQNYDYAIVVVDADLSEYGSYLLGMATDSAINNNVPIHCVGYSGNALKISNGTIEQFNTSVNDGYKDNNITFNAVSFGGTSGGPIYVESAFSMTGNENQAETYRTAVSLVSTGDRNNHVYGYYIDPIVLQFAYDNDNL